MSIHAVPKSIGGYRVLERLPSSGEAELFRAQRFDTTGGGQEVCIKRLHPNFAEDPLFEQRFMQELRLAKSLRHRNIVEVSDYGEQGGHYFFVMEYVRGASLQRLLSRGRLSPELVAYIGVELCRALGFLHRTDPVTGRKPTIHSDVSPHNVLLGRDGAVKLSDFGLAKATHRTGAETITAARGKLSYLSPEQWLEQPVSSRSDLFSLGLVLWRALIGTHPYAEDRPRARPVVPFDEWIRDRTVSNERRTVALAAPHAPSALCDAVEGLLQPLESRVPTAQDSFRLLSVAEPLDGHAQLAAWLERVEGEGW